MRKVSSVFRLVSLSIPDTFLVQKGNTFQNLLPVPLPVWGNGRANRSKGSGSQIRSRLFTSGQQLRRQIVV